jgi:hypothetical protein
MIGRVIGFVLTGSDAVTLAFIFSIPLRGTTLGGAVGESEHAGPCRFCMVAWPMRESFASRPAGFAKATVGIINTRMRVVLALLAVKIRAVAVIAAVLGAEAIL